MKPIAITYTKEEHCLIEASVNSVRISFAIKKVEIENLLTDLVGKFLALRADRFKIFRKKPVDEEKFDFCFLISEDHLVKYHKHELVNFILEFIQGIQKEITEMKLALIQQSRIAAAHYMNTLANNK